MRGVSLIAMALPVVIFVAPALGAKQGDQTGITQTTMTSSAVDQAIPLPPPGPFNAPLKPMVPEQTDLAPVKAMDPARSEMPAPKPELVISPPEIEPGAYPPEDFDPEAEPGGTAAAPVQPPAMATPQVDAAGYPPLPGDDGDVIFPVQVLEPPVQTDIVTPGEPQAPAVPVPPQAQMGWPQPAPQAGGYPPAYGRYPNPQRPQQNWGRTPGWQPPYPANGAPPRMPYRPYQGYQGYPRPNQAQPAPTGQQGSTQQ